jgi:hypothetical protein
MSGTFEVHIGGKSYVAKMNFNVLADFCDRFDLDMQQTLEIYKSRRLKPSHFRYLVYSMLSEGARLSGKDFTLTEKDVGDLLSEDVIDHITDTLSRMTNKLPEQSSSSDENSEQKKT